MPDKHAADAVFFGLQDLQAIAADLQANRGFRNGFQRFGNQAVEGLGTITGQMPAQRLVQFADGGCAIDHITAVGQGINMRIVDVLLVLELADDLFENVFKGHDT